jgi:hypothetical protein
MSEYYWWSVEVLDGAFPASLWYDAHGNALVEAAFTNRAVDWSVHRHRWGLVFEICFRDDAEWEAFRRLPAISAALDAVPDPIRGLLIYPGRGGSAASGDRRRPKPHLGAGAAPLPETAEPRLVAFPPRHDDAEPLTVAAF